MRDAFMQDAASRGLGPDAMGIMEMFAEQFEIPASWGMRSVRDAEGGLAFDVDGFLYRGTVKVVRRDGMYAVTLGDEGQETVVAEGALLDAIDRMVERDERYEERVLEAYGPVVEVIRG